VGREENRSCHEANIMNIPSIALMEHQLVYSRVLTMSFPPMARCHPQHQLTGRKNADLGPLKAISLRKDEEPEAV
jgi:hypothetical protein